MKHRKISGTGLYLSEFGFGTYTNFTSSKLDDKQFELFKIAYEAGINLFDTAEAYENGIAEIILGQVVERGIKENIWKRRDLVITTKIYWSGGWLGPIEPGKNNRGLSAKHLLVGTQNSLKRMNLEYVDLLYCHRPDVDTPLVEICRSMHQIIDIKGWSFYWGTSNWPSALITEAIAICDRYGWSPPVIEQPEYNMFKRQFLDDMHLPLFKRGLLGTTIWGPLNAGILTGKYRKAISSDSRLGNSEWIKSRYSVGLDHKNAIVTRLEKEICPQLAIKSNKPSESDIVVPSVGQLAIAWTLKNPNVTSTLLGAKNKTQLIENLAAYQYVDLLTDKILEEIEAILDNKPVSLMPKSRL